MVHLSLQSLLNLIAVNWRGVDGATILLTAAASLASTIDLPFFFTKLIKIISFRFVCSLKAANRLWWWHTPFSQLASPSHYSFIRYCVLSHNLNYFRNDHVDPGTDFISFHSADQNDESITSHDWWERMGIIDVYNTSHDIKHRCLSSAVQITIPYFVFAAVFNNISGGFILNF